VCTGFIDAETTIEEALASTGIESHQPTSSRPDQPQRQFSDFVLTQHLQSPSLRLCYLPNSVEVEFQHIPAFPEGWKWKMFLSAEMTAGETVEAIVEELGVRKVVIQGHKTARVEYVVQVIDSSGGEFFTFFTSSWRSTHPSFRQLFKPSLLLLEYSLTFRSYSLHRPTSRFDSPFLPHGSKKLVQSHSPSPGLITDLHLRLQVNPQALRKVESRVEMEEDGDLAVYSEVGEVRSLLSLTLANS